MDKRAKIAIAIAAFCGVIYIGFMVLQFKLQSFTVLGDSMKPTLEVGTMVWVWRSRDVGRGTIVAFRSPKNRKAVAIQRVIAVGGDVVEMAGNEVRVNGKPVAEPYVRYHEEADTAAFGPMRIPDGNVYVMGDNRADEGSREFHAVPREDVIGPVKFAFNTDRGVWRP